MDLLESPLARQRRYGSLLLEVADLLAAAAASAGPSPLAAVAGAVGRYFGADECTVSRVEVSSGSLTVVAAAGGSAGPDGTVQVRMPWLAARLAAGETVSFADVAALPPEAFDLRRWARSAGAAAHVTVPLRVDRRVVGGLHLTSLRAGRSWSPDRLRELEVLADFLAPAVADLVLPDAVGAEAAPTERLADVERAHILAVLRRSGWRINGAGHAAGRLGLHPNTLRSRMKKLGIARPRSRARAER